MVWCSRMGQRYLRRNYQVVCVAVAALTIICILVTGSGCSGNGCNRQSVPYIRKLPHREWSSNKNKTILRWTGFFGDSTWEHVDDRYFQRCKVKTCHITDDKEDLDKADALLFHAGAAFNFWRGISWPRSRHPHQTWILYNVEPPPRTPLNFANLEGVFNWTAWYRLDSDVPVTYGGYVQYGSDMRGKYANSSKNYHRDNPRLAAWMSSNCYDYVRRQTYIRDVREHLPLNMYGKCGGVRCPETICRDTVSDFKFFFTIENCICKDYVSEKFWEALRRGQVPVVMGGADYSALAPPHSFINTADFKDAKSLANYLLEVAGDEKKYNAYLEWTKSYDVYGEIEARRLFFCDLCEALHDKTRPAQVYDNLNGWVNNERSDCPQWTLGNQIGRWVDGWKFNWGLL